jgi:hypothetical protein
MAAMEGNEAHNLASLFRAIDGFPALPLVVGDDMNKVKLVESTLRSIKHHVSDNASLYVISICGPTRTFKSHLLNALFGTSFATCPTTNSCTSGIMCQLLSDTPASSVRANNSKRAMRKSKTSSGRFMLVLDSEGLAGQVLTRGVGQDHLLFTLCAGLSGMLMYNIAGGAMDNDIIQKIASLSTLARDLRGSDGGGVPFAPLIRIILQSIPFQLVIPGTSQRIDANKYLEIILNGNRDLRNALQGVEVSALSLPQPQIDVEAGTVLPTTAYQRAMEALQSDIVGAMRPVQPGSDHSSWQAVSAQEWFLLAARLTAALAGDTLPPMAASLWKSVQWDCATNRAVLAFQMQLQSAASVEEVKRRARALGAVTLNDLGTLKCRPEKGALLQVKQVLEGVVAQEISARSQQSSRAQRLWRTVWQSSRNVLLVYVAWKLFLWVLRYSGVFGMVGAALFAKRVALLLSFILGARKAWNVWEIVSAHASISQLLAKFIRTLEAVG